MSVISFPAGISDLVFHPDVFFERVSKGKANLILPLLIVLAAVSIFITMFILVFGQYEELSFLLDEKSLKRHVIFVLSGEALFRPFFFWAFFSVIFFALARILGGTGSILLTVQNVGYGMMPWLVSALIPLAAYLSKIFTYTSGPSSLGYYGIWMTPTTYYNYYYLPLLGILVWSGYLWIPAMEHTHGLSRKKSGMVVGIPVVACIVLTIACMGIF